MSLDEAIKIMSIKDDIIKPLDRQIALDTLVLHAEAYKVAIELLEQYIPRCDTDILAIARCRIGERTINERIKQARNHQQVKSN